VYYRRGDSMSEKLESRSQPDAAGMMMQLGMISSML
jgi:hypothetical protein